MTANLQINFIEYQKSLCWLQINKSFKIILEAFASFKREGPAKNLGLEQAELGNYWNDEDVIGNLQIKSKKTLIVYRQVSAL